MSHQISDEPLVVSSEVVTRTWNLDKSVARGHLKRRIALEVRIIDSKLPKYSEIEGKYKFYGLGWMSEAPGYYYPTMVREFYVNYIATLEGLCKKGQKLAQIHMQTHIPVCGEMVDISEAIISRMLYGPNFTSPVSTAEFDY
ncbi:hypothetical protein HAX54_003128 [Datura stramonium]|uniref:Uncharacterized protein n=1 Tax=Datura stramonium TaxID=4076 RepID=A0ABS8WU14_DATST|nr:hypothetical protein [Datura stramonium]